MKYKNDVAIIIVNRDRPDLTDNLVENLRSMETKNGKEIFVIEMGSEKDSLSKHCCHYYEDPEFRGKAYGHNVGLDFVLKNHGHYRYYWFLMNDLVFNHHPNPIDTMVEIMESEPRMGILSPTEPGSGYPDCKPHPDKKWHRVSTTDYLALLMKDSCFQEVGFLGRHFKYSWGAIHELSYKMYKKGWFIAYCDMITMIHLGGTTYGATKNTISRNEYKRNASKWCTKYFINKYGENWDEEFSKYLPGDIKINTYKKSRDVFEKESIFLLIDEYFELLKKTNKEDPLSKYLVKNKDKFVRQLEENEIPQKTKPLPDNEKTKLEQTIRQLSKTNQEQEEIIKQLKMKIQTSHIPMFRNIQNLFKTLRGSNKKEIK